MGTDEKSRYIIPPQLIYNTVMNGSSEWLRRAYELF